jgi:hypothetical protein
MIPRQKFTCDLMLNKKLQSKQAKKAECKSPFLMGKSPFLMGKSTILPI